MIQNQKCCPYCGKEFLLHNEYANHIRWCKNNPNYFEILSKFKDKLHKNKHIQIYKFNCVVCNKEYELELSLNDFTKSNYRKTCSTSCARKLTAINTDLYSKNRKISKAICKKYNKICKYCGKEFITNNIKRQFCCIKCASKYRYLNIIKTDKEIYKNSCIFKFNIYDYINEFNIDLIKEYGFYKAKNHGNNLNGVSRDHKYSINDAYNNHIDPYIIFHPANCELLLQSKNASKNYKSSISINDLVEKIKDWNKKYGVYENKIDYKIFDKINYKLKLYKDYLL